MQIAVNCRSIQKPRLTGIGRNTFHLLDYLGRIDQDNQYLLYSPKRLFDLRRRLPHFVYSNFSVKEDFFGCGLAKALGPHDLYYLPSPALVPDHPVPVVVTVYDLIYKTCPQSHTDETLLMTEEFMQSIVAKASMIICPSVSTQNDLHRFFELPRSKSCVVYSGVDHDLFFPLSDDLKGEARALVTSKGVEQPYLLSVGTLEPRKNLSNVLRAFARLKKQDRFKGQLVVIGATGWKMEETKGLIDELGISSDVIFLGYVTDEELRCFYNLAEAFVYPSFYEGFGFPILEAFCCKTPVVTSNISSCPEVAGDAALKVDPSNVNDIADAIFAIVSNDTLKEDLRNKGLLRAAEFSFQKTAQETLKVFKQVCVRN